MLKSQSRIVDGEQARADRAENGVPVMMQAPRRVLDGPRGESPVRISQRKLAAQVPGLTQDRVSKIFSGQVGHMTIDKLVEILSALRIKVALKAKAA